jgi:hypothetical protein
LMVFLYLLVRARAFEMLLRNIVQTSDTTYRRKSIQPCYSYAKHVYMFLLSFVFDTSDCKMYFCVMVYLLTSSGSRIPNGPCYLVI